MKTSIVLFLVLSGYLHADAITGWEIVEQKTTDAAVCKMERTIKEYPYIMLINSGTSGEQITGKIISVYRGELNQGQHIRCEAPKNLYKVQERYNEYTSEMFVLCKSATIDNEGIYVLNDVLVIPRTHTPFLPEVALRIALRLP